MMGMHNTKSALRGQIPLFWLIALAIVLSQVSAPIERFYDLRFLTRPWVSAELEILPADSDGVHIRYDVRAPSAVTGTWSAWLEVNGRQKCFGRGSGSYGPATKRNRVWPLDEWLGRSCAAPSTPYIACVAYVVRVDSGVSGSFGPFCSPKFDPKREARK